MSEEIYLKSLGIRTISGIAKYKRQARKNKNSTKKLKENIFNNFKNELNVKLPEEFTVDVFFDIMNRTWDEYQALDEIREKVKIIMGEKMKVSSDE